MSWKGEKEPDRGARIEIRLIWIYFVLEVWLGMHGNVLFHFENKSTLDQQQQIRRSDIQNFWCDRILTTHILGPYPQLKLKFNHDFRPNFQSIKGVGEWSSTAAQGSDQPGAEGGNR